MEFFNDLLEEIKIIELPTVGFLFKQSYMIMGVTLIFALHFELVDYLFKLISGSFIMKRLLFQN
jgi:preprotein translocase subunit SecE